MYQTLKKIVIPEVDGKKMDFSVSHYYITSRGREPEVFKDPFIEVWADGSIILNYKEKRIFLYEDQWLGVVEAIKCAIQDKKDASQAREAQWLLENGDKKVHYGSSVDLSINETKSIMDNSEYRISSVDNHNRLQILFNGKWLNVARTDLKDDVCTFTVTNDPLDIQVETYKNKNNFGSRISETTFSVVDSTSDG